MNKPTLKITLDQVFKTNFSVFDSYDDDVKKEQIAKISYIETIAHQLEKDLTGINLLEILSNNNNIILANQAEINNALIEFDRAKFNNAPEIEAFVVKELNDEQKEKINKAYQRTNEERKRSFNSNIQSYIRDAERYLEEHNNYLAKVRTLRLELEAIGDVNSKPLEEAIDILMKNDKFEFLGFCDNSIEFAVRKNIICTYKNERTKVDLRVDFGILKLRLNLSSLRMKCYKHKDNIQVRDGYHPHISSSGDICLGNMSELFIESRDNLDINQMFEVVFQVLTNYNDDDPYINLADYAENSRQVQPNGMNMRRNSQRSQSSGATRGQVHECPHCEYENEVEFLAEGDSDYAEHECSHCGAVEEYEYFY